MDFFHILIYKYVHQPIYHIQTPIISGTFTTNIFSSLVTITYSRLTNWQSIYKNLYRLFHQEADIGVNAFTVTYSRAQVVDFTMPFWEEASSFLIKIPDENKLTLYLKPFKVYFIFAPKKTWNNKQTS